MQTKTTKREQDRLTRTQKIIETFRNLPGEYYMLKGLLCVESALRDEQDRATRKHIADAYDTHTIAKRMDEINREACAKMLREIEDEKQRASV